MKKSFILYNDYKDLFVSLSDEQAGCLIKSIFEYESTGIVPKMEPILSTVFILIKQSLDRDKEKYSRVVERNKQNINKRWNIPNDTKNTTGKSGIPKIPNDTKNTDNDNDNDNVNEYIKENEKEKKSFVANATENEDRLKKRTKEFYQTLIPFTNTYGKEMVREFYNYWTEPNKSKTKMRFELEKTWDTSRRLLTWSNRNKVTKQGNEKGYENKPIETYTITD